ncbi:MAG: hypothetical protein AAF441_23025 [Pseudomonadota bacterium]
MPFERLLPAALIAITAALPAGASDQLPAPQGVTGSDSVIVEGQRAKRAGDIPGAIFSPNVIINGQPVITGCSEGTPILSPSVIINGKPKILGCQK